MDRGTTSLEALRSAVASSLPTSRSPWRIGNAKKPHRRFASGLYISSDVLEVEQVDGPAAVVGQAVERRQQGGAAVEWPAELLRVDAPGPRRRPRPSPARRPRPRRSESIGTAVACRARDAQRPQPPFGAEPVRLVVRDTGVRPGRPARPGPTCAAAPMRPAMATSPRVIRNSSIWVTLRSLVHPVDGQGTCARVRDVAGQQRAGVAEPLEDVAPEPVVGPSHARERSCRLATSPCPRGTGGGRPSAGRRRSTRTASGPARAPAAGAPACSPIRAGSTRPGPRSARPPPSGRSGASSAGRRRRAGRWVAAHPAAGRGSRSVALPRHRVDGRPPAEHTRSSASTHRRGRRSQAPVRCVMAQSSSRAILVGQDGLPGRT